MQNRVEGQQFITARNKTYDIFDDGKFSKPYLQKLTVNTKSFLDRAKNANANRQDVTDYLRNRGFVNSAIQTNPEFIGFIQKVVPEHRVGMVLPPKQDAIRHLRRVVRFDPKYFNKRLSREEILEDLKNSNKTVRMDRQLSDAIKAIIGRHNAGYTKLRSEKFRKGNRLYNVVFSAVVWNEQEQKEYREDRSIMFKSDLKSEEITKEIIEDIVEGYYAERDYPDFIRLVDYKFEDITDDKSITEMNLLDVICGKKYRNNYIRSYKDLVENYQEKEGKCLNILLQTNYKTLVDRRMVAKKKLTDKYIDDFFAKERNIKRLLEFVKELKYASIYIFDQIGKELIASHKAKTEHGKATTTVAAIALVGDHHVESVSDTNVKKSVANGDKLTIFNTSRCFEDEQFELFDDPLALALSFDDECNTEYQVEGKDSKAPVILFVKDPKLSSWQVTERLMAKVSEKYNVVITNIMDDNNGMPIGFVHPVTDQLYLYQEHYEQRKEICDILHKYSNNDAFKWKLQSILKLSQLGAEQLDLLNMYEIVSELSKGTETCMSTTQSPSQ